MSKSNKSAREALEKIYGKHCMIHQGIRKLRPPRPHGKSYKGKSIAAQLTYHHLRAKRNGGDATVENGAVLCRSCHDWIEQLSNSEREQVNNELRQYKREHSKECTVEFVDFLPLDFEVKVATFTPEQLMKPKYNRAEVKRDTRKKLEEWEEER